jgi:hypothetical protein
MGNIHRSMQGKEVDMEKLMRQHELMPAIGNVKVNARGDQLGPGGQIIKKREDLMAEYYENNPKAIPEKNNPIEPKTTKIVEPNIEPVVEEEMEIEVEVAPTRKGKSNNES